MYLCTMIFVTGGTGLVGSHILLKLSQQGKEFKALKRASSSLEICKSIFSYYKSDDLFTKTNWISGNINDIPSLESGMQDCDMLLHCAAVVSFHPSDVELLKKVNIEKMNNILYLALEQIAKISILFNPVIPICTTKVLNALNIKSELRNLSFLDGKNIFTNEIKINDLDILFKKTTQ